MHLHTQQTKYQKSAQLNTEKNPEKHLHYIFYVFGFFQIFRQQIKDTVYSRHWES